MLVLVIKAYQRCQRLMMAFRYFRYFDENGNSEVFFPGTLWLPVWLMIQRSEFTWRLEKEKILKVLTFCAIVHQEILDHPWLQRSKEKVANEEQKQDLGEKGGSCFKCCAPKNVSSDYCHFNPELLLQALQEDFVWWFFIGWSFPDLCCATVCTMFIIKCSRTPLLRPNNCLYIACSTSKLRSKVCALFSFMFSLCDAFHNCCIWSKPSIFRLSILNIKH